MVTYDIAKLTSFNNIQRWLTELKEHADPSIVVMIVGNKSDLKHLRAVNEEDAAEFAKQNELLFTETSALDSTNVETAFTETIKKVHEIQVAKIRKQVQGLTTEEVTAPDIPDVGNRNQQKQQNVIPCCRT